MGKQVTYTDAELGRITRARQRAQHMARQAIVEQHMDEYRALYQQILEDLLTPEETEAS